MLEKSTLIEFEPLLTVDEIAKYLRLKPHQVYNLTRKKRSGFRALPCYRGVGKHLKFRLSEVSVWLQSQKQVAA